MPRAGYGTRERYGSEVRARGAHAARPARSFAPFEEGSIFGVPARFMGPRLTLIAMTFCLVAFGLLMIYSASSISLMSNEAYDNNAAYYVTHQLIYAAAGTLLATFIALTPYRWWSRLFLPIIWLGTVFLLGLVFTPFAGAGEFGATRWIRLGSFALQPSEFAKITIVLTASCVATRYFEEGVTSFERFIGEMLLFVFVPIGMILLQPDKGTTIVCCLTLLVMGYLAGIPKSTMLFFVSMGALAILVMALKDDYSRARIMTMLNPWKDEFGDGYQIIQGFYAFGSGGLFGVGVGLSRQKYFYLPFAHNDFIFAVVGEELGLMGTLGMLGAFAILGWAGFKICRYAPDLTGRLIAAGCTSMLIIQLLVNVCGVLSLIPLSGKPIPFVSYGGTSVVSCLILVGFILSVSRASVLPDTPYERERESWGIAEDFDEGLSLVGDPTPRSARTSAGPSLALVRDVRPAYQDRYGARQATAQSSYGRRSATSGGALHMRDTSPEALRAARERLENSTGRVSVGSNGRERIDLGPSGADRLRGRRR